MATPPLVLNVKTTLTSLVLSVFASLVFTWTLQQATAWLVMLLVALVQELEIQTVLPVVLKPTSLLLQPAPAEKASSWMELVYASHVLLDVTSVPTVPPVLLATLTQQLQLELVELLVLPIFIGKQRLENVYLILAM